MDALKFLRERKRMCNSYKDCDSCPTGVGKCAVSNITTDEDYKRVIDTVEQWSKMNPVKMRQSVFLEQYPEARIGDDGVLQIYPCLISASHRNARGNCATMGRACSDCCREFWSQEVE